MIGPVRTQTSWFVSREHVKPEFRVFIDPFSLPLSLSKTLAILATGKEDFLHLFASAKHGGNTLLRLPEWWMQTTFNIKSHQSDVLTAKDLWKPWYVSLNCRVLWMNCISSLKRQNVFLSGPIRWFSHWMVKVGFSPAFFACSLYLSLSSCSYSFSQLAYGPWQSLLGFWSSLVTTGW